MLDQLYLAKDAFLSNFKRIWGHFYIRIYFFIILGLNALFYLVANRAVSKFNTNLAVLHYNVDFGVDLAGNPNRFFILPAIASVFLIVNFITLFVLPRSGRLFAHVLLFSALFAQIILMLAALLIYQSNFR